MRKGFAQILILGLVVAIFALGGAFYIKQFQKPHTQIPTFIPEPSINPPASHIANKTAPSPTSITQSPIPISSPLLSNFLVISARASASLGLLITDPNGIQTGDLPNKKFVSDILGSSYVHEPGIAYYPGNGGHTPPSVYFGVNYPIKGVYLIRATGVINDSYNIDIGLLDSKMVSTDKLFNGTTALGQINTFSIDTNTGIITQIN